MTYDEKYKQLAWAKLYARGEHQSVIECFKLTYRKR